MSSPGVSVPCIHVHMPIHRSTHVYIILKIKVKKKKKQRVGQGLSTRRCGPCYSGMVDTASEGVVASHLTLERLSPTADSDHVFWDAGKCMVTQRLSCLLGTVQ